VTPALRPALAILCALAVALSAVGCGGGRSETAFCDALDDGIARLKERARTAQSKDNAVEGLALALGNFGEFEKMLDELAAAAPDGIRNDTEIARDTFKEQADPNVGADSTALLGALASRVLTGLQHAPSFERVDRYAHEHCGKRVFGSGS
jgi:hypothetical protein